MTQKGGRGILDTVNSGHLEEKTVREARVQELEWVENADLFTAMWKHGDV